MEKVIDKIISQQLTDLNRLSVFNQQNTECKKNYTNYRKKKFFKVVYTYFQLI